MNAAASLPVVVEIRGKKEWRKRVSYQEGRGQGPLITDGT
jgi:hypothetical protein